MSLRVFLCLCFLAVIFAIDGNPPIIDSGGKNMNESDLESTPIPADIIRNTTKATLTRNVSEELIETASSITESVDQAFITVPPLKEKNTESDLESTPIPADIIRSTTKATLTRNELIETASSITESVDQAFITVTPLKEKNTSTAKEAKTERVPLLNVFKGQANKPPSYKEVMDLEDLLKSAKEMKIRDMNHDEKEPNLPFGLEVTLVVNKEEIQFNFEKVTHKLHAWVPFVATNLEGQKSVWMHAADEVVDTYCDVQRQLCATISLKKINGHLLRFFSLKFTLDGKTFVVEPPAEFLSASRQANYFDVPSLENLIFLKGTPHYLIEIIQDSVNASTRGKPKVLPVFLALSADYTLYSKYQVIYQRSEESRIKLAYDMIRFGEDLIKMLDMLSSEEYKLDAVITEIKIFDDPDMCQWYDWSESEQMSVDGASVVAGFKSLFDLDKLQARPANTMFIVLSGIPVTEQGLTTTGHTEFQTMCRDISVAVVAHTFLEETIQSSTHLILKAMGLQTEGAWDETGRYNSVKLNEVFKELKENHSECFSTGDPEKNKIAKPYDGRLPGTVHTLKQQCQLSFGPDAKPCWEGPVCGALKCKIAEECLTMEGLYAMDGTPCAQSAWCLNNVCQYDSRAPSVFEGSPINNCQIDVMDPTTPPPSEVEETSGSEELVNAGEAGDSGQIQELLLDIKALQIWIKVITALTACSLTAVTVVVVLSGLLLKLKKSVKIPLQ